MLNSTFDNISDDNPQNQGRNLQSGASKNLVDDSKLSIFSLNGIKQMNLQDIVFNYIKNMILIQGGPQYINEE